MNMLSSCFVIFCIFFTFIDGQQLRYSDQNIHFFRFGGLPQVRDPQIVEPSVSYSKTVTKKRPPLSTFIVTYSTSTSTLTSTTVTICTTSTAALEQCSRRRRRDLRGLFYNEDEYLALSSKELKSEPVKHPEDPIEIYISDSEGLMDAGYRDSRRVKLSFFVASFVITETTSSILTLTATCETKTHFDLCGVEKQPAVLKDEIIYVNVE